MKYVRLWYGVLLSVFVVSCSCSVRNDGSYYTYEEKVNDLQRELRKSEPDYYWCNSVLKSPTKCGDKHNKLIQGGEPHVKHQRDVISELARRGVVYPRSGFGKCNRYARGRKNQQPTCEDTVNRWKYAVIMGAVRGGHTDICSQRPQIGNIDAACQREVIFDTIDKNAHVWKSVLHTHLLDGIRIPCSRYCSVCTMISNMMLQPPVYPVSRIHRCAYVLSCLNRSGSLNKHTMAYKVPKKLLAFRGTTADEAMKREERDEAQQSNYVYMPLDQNNNTHDAAALIYRKNIDAVVREYARRPIRMDGKEFLRLCAACHDASDGQIGNNDHKGLAWLMAQYGDSGSDSEYINCIIDTMDQQGGPDIMGTACMVTPQALLRKIYHNITPLHYAAASYTNLKHVGHWYLRLRRHTECPPLKYRDTSLEYNNKMPLYRAMCSMHNKHEMSDIDNLYNLMISGIKPRVPDEILHTVYTYM